MAPRDDSAFLQSRRPWFALYGLRLKRGRVEDNDDEEEEREASRLLLLPQDLMYKILHSCDPTPSAARRAPART